MGKFFCSSLYPLPFTLTHHPIIPHHPSPHHSPSSINLQHPHTAPQQHHTTAPQHSMTKKSKYRFIKDGWGNRVNFQASFGLKMTPDDLEEGNLILEALMNDSDLEEGKEKTTYIECILELYILCVVCVEGGFFCFFFFFPFLSFFLIL